MNETTKQLLARLSLIRLREMHEESQQSKLTRKEKMEQILEMGVKENA